MVWSYAKQPIRTQSAAEQLQCKAFVLLLRSGKKAKPPLGYFDQKVKKSWNFSRLKNDHQQGLNFFKTDLYACYFALKWKDIISLAVLAGESYSTTTVRVQTNKLSRCLRTQWNSPTK